MNAESVWDHGKKAIITLLLSGIVVCSTSSGWAKPRTVADTLQWLKERNAVSTTVTTAQFKRLSSAQRQRVAAMVTMSERLGVAADVQARVITDYIVKPTSKTGSNGERALVQTGLGLPQVAARSGLTARAILETVVLLGSLGDTPGQSDVQNAKTWELIRTKGRNAVVADKVRTTFDIPADVSQGLSARALLKGIKEAGRTGQATNSKGFWAGYSKKVKDAAKANAASTGNRGSSKTNTTQVRPRDNTSGDLTRPGSNSGGARNSGPGTGSSDNTFVGGKTAEAGDTTITVTHKETRGDGSTRIDVTITYSDGSKEQRVIVVETDGSSNVYDAQGENGNLLAWYEPGTNKITEVQEGDTWVPPAGDTGSYVATDADKASGQGGSSTGSGSNSNGNSGGNNGNSNGDGSGDGDDGSGDDGSSDDGDDNGDGKDDSKSTSESTEQEAAEPANEGEENASTSEEGGGRPNPLSDEYAGPPLWMLVNSRFGRGEQTQGAKLISTKRGGGFTDPAPDSVAGRAVQVLLDRQTMRMVQMAIATGMGGGYTDPSDGSTGLNNVADPKAVAIAKTGIAADRPERTPMTPGNIPGGLPGGPGPRLRVAGLRVRSQNAASDTASRASGANISMGLAQFLAGRELSSISSGAVIVNATFRNGQLTTVTVDEAASTLRDTQTLGAMRSALLHWQPSVGTGVNGTWRLVVDVRANR